MATENAGAHLAQGGVVGRKVGQEFFARDETVPFR